MKHFNIITAMCRNWGIGKNNGLPWYYKKDMSYFKKMTTPSTIGSKSVIMGSKTWKSLPGRNGLIGRNNIVISQSDKTRALIYGEAVHNKCNVNVVGSLDEALLLCKFDSDIPWVIGGSKIYDIAMKHSCANELHLSFIDKEYNCDVFLPKIPRSYSLITARKERENGTDIYFCTLKQIGEDNDEEMNLIKRIMEMAPH